MPFTTRIKQFAASVRFDYLILALALILSCIIRFKPVVEGTFPFLYDHGRDMLDVQKIVEQRDLTLIGPTTGLKGLFHGPLHYYLLSVGYILSGGHPASGVVMVVLFQLTGGVLCYFLGKKYVGRTFGLVLSVFYLLSYVSINTSVMFWNPYWIPFFMVLFYFSLLHSLQRDKRCWMITGLLAGIIAQFEIAFGAFLLPMLLLSAVFFDRSALKSIYFWLAFIAYGIPSLPLILFDFLHEHIMFNSIMSVLNGSYVGLGESIPLETRFNYRLFELMRYSIFATTMHSVIAWTIFILSAGYGVYSAVKGNHEEKRYFLLFLLLPVLVFTGFMIYDKPAWSYYWVGIQVSYYFFAAYAFSRLLTIRHLVKLVPALVVVIFALHSVTVMMADTSFLKTEPGIYRNQLAVIDTIYADAGNEEFGAWVYTPPIYDHTYRYIFSWRGKQRGYVPTERTDRNYYLIIEKNKDRPWEAKGWRETKVKAIGAPEWVRSFDGDITLEKYAYGQDR